MAEALSRKLTGSPGTSTGHDAMLRILRTIFIWGCNRLCSYTKGPMEMKGTTMVRPGTHPLKLDLRALTKILRDTIQTYNANGRPISYHRIIITTPLFYIAQSLSASLPLIALYKHLIVPSRRPNRCPPQTSSQWESPRTSLFGSA